MQFHFNWIESSSWMKGEPKLDKKNSNRACSVPHLLTEPLCHTLIFVYMFPPSLKVSWKVNSPAEIHFSREKWIDTIFVYGILIPFLILNKYLMSISCLWIWNTGHFFVISFLTSLLSTFFKKGKTSVKVLRWAIELYKLFSEKTRNCILYGIQQFP